MWSATWLPRRPPTPASREPPPPPHPPPDRREPCGRLGRVDPSGHGAVGAPLQEERLDALEPGAVAGLDRGPEGGVEDGARPELVPENPVLAEDELVLDVEREEALE